MRKGRIGACEILRLPEELLSAALSLTTPPEAARAATVSRPFRAAADSDDVWACFLPSDLPPLASGDLDPAPSSKKEIFLRLSDRPALLADGLTSMWLDKKTGAKCYMLSARALRIFGGDKPRYWRWIPLTDCSSRFSECAELLGVTLLIIEGRISCYMLPLNSNYGAYIVFKIADNSYGLDYPRFAPQEARLEVGERMLAATREVYLEAWPSRVAKLMERPPHRFLPKRRADGWMELEMAGFRVEEGDVGEVKVELRQQRLKSSMKGLVLLGIEIRPQVAKEAFFSWPSTPGFI